MSMDRAVAVNARSRRGPFRYGQSGQEPTAAGAVQSGAPRESRMLKWALFFLIISIVAGVFGFTGISAAAAGIAKILFVIFLVVFLVLLVMGLIAGSALF